MSVDVTDFHSDPRPKSSVMCYGNLAKWLFHIINHLTLNHRLFLLKFGKNDSSGFWSNTTSSSSWMRASQITGTFDGRVPLAWQCRLQVAAGSADESIGNSCAGETRRGTGVQTGMRSGDSNHRRASSRSRDRREKAGQYQRRFKLKYTQCVSFPLERSCCVSFHEELMI